MTLLTVESEQYIFFFASSWLVNVFQDNEELLVKFYLWLILKASLI